MPYILSLLDIFVFIYGNVHCTKTSNRHLIIMDMIVGLRFASEHRSRGPTFYNMLFINILINLKDEKSKPI